MTLRMLIDARHREETRVAVVKGTRIEEFDFESAERKQLKGNIYLAKVTRVEPSLQAAFVDYGGNRHGFLAFSEIHPDYYQIPSEDRAALLREEAEHAAEEERLRANEQDDDEDRSDDDHADDDDQQDGAPRPVDLHADDDDEQHEDEEAAGPAPKPRAMNNGNGDDHAVESLRQKRMNLRRRYKIQDVIHRRQVLLVQIVKEERGNKGAALTTYLSLAGRYCVLMPNTSHGGGISRKISNATDRKRLKSIMADLQLPSSMGCIVRTAGLQRTKSEIKRDFDYLARLWDEIRETTLKSAAPALIYGDSDLIKRAIRDIYNRDIEEVIVEGEEGYRQARAFMKLLMPAHARKVKLYIDTVPLFQRGGVEEQLSAMYNPVVQLKSGGYLVINPTEALVSIDINSGRSTREHNIEQTALSTNLEAAPEIARQLRLRDMAGLVVIDFIDMESNGNNRKVERAMKEALKNDRARIQVGRISSFGLFEMSRQRLRTGVLEASTRTCMHCEGTGLVRTASSAGLSALRMLEDEAARGRGSQLCLRASQEAAFYVLNRKRSELAEIEDRFGVMIEIIPERDMEGARMAVESHGPPPTHAPRMPVLPPIEAEDDEDLIEEEELDEEEIVEAEDREAQLEREPRGDRGEGEGGRRRRRRRRRGGRREELPATDSEVLDATEGPADADLEETEATHANADLDTAHHGEPVDEEGEGAPRRRGRRGRRGGRGGRGRTTDTVATEAETDESFDASAASDDAVEAIAEQETMPVAGERVETDETLSSAAGDLAVEAVAEQEMVAPSAATAEPAGEEARPRTRRRPRARKEEVPAEAVTEADLSPEPPAEATEAPARPKRARRTKATTPEETRTEAEANPDTSPAAADITADETPKPKRTRRKKTDQPNQPVDESAPAEAAPVAAEAETGVEASPENTADAEPAEGSPRRGWWQRTFGT